MDAVGGEGFRARRCSSLTWSRTAGLKPEPPCAEWSSFPHNQEENTERKAAWAAGTSLASFLEMLLSIVSLLECHWKTERTQGLVPSRACAWSGILGHPPTPPRGSSCRHPTGWKYLQTRPGHQQLDPRSQACVGTKQSAGHTKEVQTYLPHSCSRHTTAWYQGWPWEPRWKHCGWRFTAKVCSVLATFMAFILGFLPLGENGKPSKRALGKCWGVNGPRGC